MTSSDQSAWHAWRRMYFWPSEHGAWIWWIGPFLIGTAAGGHPHASLLLLFVAALAGFLLRQPATIAVKALSGRRPRSDLAPSLFWLTAYALLAALAAAALILSGYRQLLVLAIPAALVFAWHLILVGRREERHQTGIEVIASGVLALAAPAAYQVSGGTLLSQAAILWVLTWFQSAASILAVAARLQHRRVSERPDSRAAWKQATPAIACGAFNFLGALALAGFGLVPMLVPVAFALMLIDVLEGAIHPPTGARPAAIGIRQLLVTSAFAALTAIGYWMAPIGV